MTGNASTANDVKARLNPDGEIHRPGNEAVIMDFLVECGGDVEIRAVMQ